MIYLGIPWGLLCGRVTLAWPERMGDIGETIPVNAQDGGECIKMNGHKTCYLLKRMNGVT